MNYDVFKLNAEIEEAHWWFTARREIICGLVKEIVPPGKDSLVIDVGCGTGANIAALADEYSVVGIDVTEDAIGFAKQRFPAVTFHCGDAVEYLRTLTDRTDVVILLNDVLEHIEKAYDFFRDLFEVSPNGAYFVVTVPANPDLWSPHDVSHGHFRRYVPDTFREHWSGLPVEELLFSYYNARLYPVVKGLRAMTSLLGRSYGSSDTDLSFPPKFVNRFLHSIFAGELSGLRSSFGGGYGGFTRGVSIVAVLRKNIVL